MYGIANVVFIIQILIINLFLMQRHEGVIERKICQHS